MFKITPVQLNEHFGITCGEAVAEFLEPWYKRKIEIKPRPTDLEVYHSRFARNYDILSAQLIRDSFELTRLMAGTGPVEPQYREFAANGLWSLSALQMPDMSIPLGRTDVDIAWEPVWSGLNVGIVFPGQSDRDHNLFQRVKICNTNLWDLAFINLRAILEKQVRFIIQSQTNRDCLMFDPSYQLTTFEEGLFIAGYYETGTRHYPGKRYLLLSL